MKFNFPLLRNILIFVCLVHQSCDTSDFLDSQDRSALFREPVQSELDAVLLDWNSRDLMPQEYKIDEEIAIGTVGTVLKIVSFKVSGYKRYGAIIVPNSDSAVAVRLSLNGFSFNPENMETSVALSSNEAFDIPLIFAVPAFRGQAVHLVLNGVPYSTPISEGNKCEAFDEATDDAIAFLNIIENEISNADMARCTVRGGSRGGTVAMLMGQRDDRVQKVISIAGPTDMLTLTSKNENDAIYKCQFLEDLVMGAKTISQARNTMIASSPIYFAERLPPTQLHLAEDDKIVPVLQGEQLLKKMQDLGLTDNFELFVYENRNHGNIVDMNEQLIVRVQDFLRGF